MYQNTDRKCRDYYMATFGINLPNRGRRNAELAQSKEKQLQADQELRSQIQKQFAEIQDRFVFANTSAEQLKIYKEGLIPQADATFRSALAASHPTSRTFKTLSPPSLTLLILQ